MDYLSLISRYESSLSADDTRKYKAFLVKMQNTFGDSFDVWSMEKIQSLFTVKSGIISKSSFYETKRWFNITISELLKDGLISEKLFETLSNQVKNIKLENVIAEGEIRQTYFKNLDDVLNFIALVGSQSGSDDMLLFKSYAILVWQGFTTEEIVDITKDSLVPETCSINFKGHKRVVSQKEFNILSKFANQTTYLGVKGAPRTYVPSIYLFRSYNKIHLEPNNLNCEIYYFNKEAEGYGKKIIYTSLSLNGLFYNILIEEQNNKVSSANELINDYLIKVCGMEKSVASHKAARYKVWKNIYYNI